MADDFHTYDNRPIVGLESITFRAWRFSFRELVLGLVAIGLLVACILMAGFLGKTSTDLKQAQTSALKVQVACKDSTCMRTSAHIMELINASADPCDNFYTFACGSYRVNNPTDTQTLYQSVLKQMYENNQDQLLAILNSPSNRYLSWSSERKVKDFYMSCKDDFLREKLRGTPLLQKVFPLLGGWFVKDGSSWDASSWTLDDPLKKVHTDLWVDALYAPRVRQDEFASKNRIIWIYPGGTGKYLNWKDYSTTPTPSQAKLQADYKNFMRTVAQLLTRDAGLSASADQGLANRIETFVNDVYEVESDLAKFSQNAEYQRDAYREANRLTLNQLTQTTGGQIDWTVQMSYLFDENRISGNTKVIVPYPTYLTNLTAMIRGLDSSSRNRKLHNYLTWRVLEWYVQELSWDYVHANRQYYLDKFGVANFMGIPNYCFYMAKQEFGVALSALYINARFTMENRDKVKDITESIKAAIEDMLTKNQWMDQPTKDYAIAKMKGSKYKLGFPDFMTDETQVDAVYAELSINRSDYLGNNMAANMQHKREWNRLLREGEDRDQWFFSTYATNLAVYWYWDEIIVPAGILRFPMYEHDMPHYYSFGAFGTILGHFVHHLVDFKGRRWDKGGDFLRTQLGWWSNSTYHNYKEAEKCVADLYSNQTQGPYTARNGDQTVVYVKGAQFASEAMAITTGIRLAYNAYQTWQQQYGRDFYSPGLPYNPLQLFFIAHAQVQCYNRDPFYEYLYAQRGRVHQDVRVNLAYQELPEFRQAFQCQASDNMVSEKPCTYY